MNTKGKVVFITGGVSGIGLATAKKFLSEGAKVVIYSKNIKELSEELGGNALVIEGDVCSREQVKKAIKTTIQKFGKLDVLINNAGVAQRKLFLETQEKDWDFIFSVNVKGVFVVTQEALKIMGSGEDKVIINIASGAGIYGIAELSIYSATKAAVINFTLSLSQELASRKIRVITVAPGSVDTQMFHSLFKARTPSHTPEEVAEIIYETAIGKIKPDDRLIVDVFHHTR